jgi:hypothetical protein
MKLPPGVTYRQLHYWVSRGYVMAAGDPDMSPGSGHHRTWIEANWDKLVAMGKLRENGFEAQLASRVAEAALQGSTEVELDDIGVILKLDFKKLTGAGEDSDK